MQCHLRTPNDSQRLTHNTRDYQESCSNQETPWSGRSILLSELIHFFEIAIELYNQIFNDECNLSCLRSTVVLHAMQELLLVTVFCIVVPSRLFAQRWTIGNELPLSAKTFLWLTRWSENAPKIRNLAREKMRRLENAPSKWGQRVRCLNRLKEWQLGIPCAIDHFHLHRNCNKYSSSAGSFFQSLGLSCWSLSIVRSRPFS